MYCSKKKTKTKKQNNNNNNKNMLRNYEIYAHRPYIRRLSRLLARTSSAIKHITSVIKYFLGTMQEGALCPHIAHIDSWDQRHAMNRAFAGVVVFYNEVDHGLILQSYFDCIKEFAILQQACRSATIIMTSLVSIAGLQNSIYCMALIL